MAKVFAAGDYILNKRCNKETLNCLRFKTLQAKRVDVNFLKLVSANALLFTVQKIISMVRTVLVLLNAGFGRNALKSGSFKLISQGIYPRSKRRCLSPTDKAHKLLLF